MLALRIEGEYHWGFWSRVPETSKIQPTLPIPPPTTLIGALAYPLFSSNFLASEGEVKVSSVGRNKSYLSPAVDIEGFFYATAFRYKGHGMVFDDVNKYIGIHFQGSQLNYAISEEYAIIDIEKIQGVTEEEKMIIKKIRESGYIEFDELVKKLKLNKRTAKKIINDLVAKKILIKMPRRMLPKFRLPAIVTGKVYVPTSFVIIYLLNEGVIRNKLGNNWKEKLVFAALNITRIGSKESLVSVKNSEIIEVKELSEKEVTTALYFPSRCVVEVLEGEYYRETFWTGGWGRGTERNIVEYIIPGSKTPLNNKAVRVKLSNKAKAFKLLLDEEVIISDAV